MRQEHKLDELEQYLEDPEEPELDVKVLQWWAAKESKWPNLAKMAKQYFALPASSAGVERVFSAAGKMHSDLKKSAKEGTLEHIRSSQRSTLTDGSRAWSPRAEGSVVGFGHPRREVGRWSLGCV